MDKEIAIVKCLMQEYDHLEQESLSVLLRTLD